MFGVERRMRVGRGLAAVALAALLVGCGDDSAPTSDAGDDPTTTAAPQFEDRTGRDRVEMQVVDNSFLPRHVKVSAGTTLVFTNSGRNPHDITPVTDGAFEKVPSDEFGPGATVEITFAESGEIAYYCTIHGTPRNGQNGTIKVVS